MSEVMFFTGSTHVTKIINVQYNMMPFPGLSAPSKCDRSSISVCILHRFVNMKFEIIIINKFDIQYSIPTQT